MPAIAVDEAVNCRVYTPTIPVEAAQREIAANRIAAYQAGFYRYTARR